MKIKIILILVFFNNIFTYYMEENSFTNLEELKNIYEEKKRIMKKQQKSNLKYMIQ